MGRRLMDMKSRSEFFWSHVSKGGPNGCWLWTGTKTSTGYGNFSMGNAARKWVKAHRFAYEEMRGPIEVGLVLDHLCRTPLCVNPAHLEPVIQQVNVGRGVGHGSEMECPRGHAYDETNTYWHGGKRFCRECHRINRKPKMSAGG